MEIIKLLVFIEFIILMLCLTCDIVSYFLKEEFERSTYWISSIVVIGSILICLYVVNPLFEWWMK